MTLIAERLSMPSGIAFRDGALFVAADGTPNVTYLSKVMYVDPQHVALSNQFFSKTVQNIRENPYAQLTLLRPKDGVQARLDVRYARQPGVLGSADTVVRALEVGAEPPLLVTAADTVYSPGDLARFCAAFAASGAAGAMAVRRDPPPDPKHRTPVRVVDGVVEAVIDDDPDNPLGSAPLWLLGPELVPLLEGLPGPPYELADAFRRALDAGLAIAGIEIGKTRDLTGPVDLVKENFPYLGS